MYTTSTIIFSSPFTICDSISQGKNKKAAAAINTNKRTAPAGWMTNFLFSGLPVWDHGYAGLLHAPGHFDHTRRFSQTINRRINLTILCHWNSICFIIIKNDIGGLSAPALGGQRCQLFQTDAQTQMEVTTKIEVDKPGFLSFLGIGETDERSMQSVFSKSSSSLVVVGQTVSYEFTLHGDGNRDHYYCEVYIDAIFGTFAYHDNANDLDHRRIIQNSPGPKSVKNTPPAG